MAKAYFLKDQPNQNSLYRVAENDAVIPTGLRLEQFNVLEITIEQYNQIVNETHTSQYDENNNVLMIEVPVEWNTKENFERYLNSTIELRTRKPEAAHLSCLEQLRNSHEENNFEFPNTFSLYDMCSERSITWVGYLNIFNESN
jgi:hypothetical protein|tara:strand:- start:3936 stop:4367 length:432 start_codon:yes stop_codon:yes gene_type:complete